MSTPTPQGFKALPDDATHSAPLVVAEISRLPVASSAPYGNVTVANAATVIVAANTGNMSVSVYNNGATTVYIGTDASVTTVNGMPVPAGGEREVRTQTGLWGIVATGTADVRYLTERL